MASLLFMAGPIAGRRYSLGDGEYVIGRQADCQIFVPDMRVSRQHARLKRDGDNWSLEDLGSNNGTFINGVRLSQPTKLRHDDEIAIANNRIRIEARDGANEPEPVIGNAVTIVDVAASSLIRSRDDSSPPFSRVGVMSSGV